MAVNGHEFTWEETGLFNGIRQDAIQSAQRFRLVRNLNWLALGAFTKDYGLQPVNPTAIADSSATNGRAEIYGLYDAIFNDDTQILAVVTSTSTASKYALREYNSTTLAFDLLSAALKTQRPAMTMFGDKLIVMDGSQMRAVDSASSVTSVGGTTYGIKASFGRVYANRLVIGGDPDFPFQIFPSGIRDASTFEGTDAIDITNVHGEEATGMGLCGPFLIVGGQRWTRAYYLGTASPRDWDFDEVSTSIGPTSHQSFVDIPQVGGDSSTAACLFWSREGPYMVVQFGGRGVPRLVDVGFPLQQALKFVAFEGVPGFDFTNYANVSGAYVPEFDEVRFTIRSVAALQAGVTRSDIVLCLNMRSALAHAADPNSAYPMWRIRDNEGNYLPASTIGIARMNPNTGFVFATGIERCLLAGDGHVYEMDSSSRDMDWIAGSEYPIKWNLIRDGYDGIQDGIRVHSKCLTTLYVRTKQIAESELYATIIPESGNSVDVTIELPPQSIWTPNPNIGAWGDGGVWNGSGFSIERGQTKVIGKQFTLELYDNGNLEGGFQLGDWTLLGNVEDRR